jgi:hypothetical protein
MVWTTSTQIGGTFCTQGVYQTMDESMSDYRPCKDKLGGLLNIAYIHLKLKPMGTELKTMCDCATGVIVYMEERGHAMPKNKHAHENGVSTACVQRMAEDASDEGMTLSGDAWFKFVKVREA